MTCRNEEAAHWLERAVELKPDYAQKHYNLGSVYLRLGRFKEAAAALERAVRLEPNRLETRLNLGYAYAKLKRYRAAIAGGGTLLVGGLSWVLARRLARERQR